MIAASPRGPGGEPQRERQPAGAPTALSYTALALHERCGYRFYAERVLGLPAGEGAAMPGGGGAGAELTAVERGIVVHELLERIDFRRVSLPDAEAICAAAGRTLREATTSDVGALIERFVASGLGARLGGASVLRREQPFGFVLADRLITGALDVLAEENRGSALVVDYKTDRLEGRIPVQAATGYELQRSIYALAALRAGYQRVEVAHVFLELPDDPVVVGFTVADLSRLEAELLARVAAVAEEDYRVTDAPHRALCSGCPAEGGLCSWPLSMTRRVAVDRLF